MHCEKIISYLLFNNHTFHKNFHKKQENDKSTVYQANNIFIDIKIQQNSSKNKTYPKFLKINNFYE